MRAANRHGDHRVKTAASAPDDSRLRRSVLMAFTLPTLILGIMHGPEGQIQAVYAKHAGLSLTALALAMLLTKLFDAVTYPLIGYLSDRTYARSGTRKAWVVAGTVVSVLGIWMLLRPPQGVDVVYFGIWMAVTYLGWKIMEIPIQAWSYGLSADYVQRTRVQGWRAMAQMGGQLLFFVIPFIAMKLGQTDSSELDFRSLGVSAVVCAIALPLATLIAVLHTPNGVAAPPPQTTAKRPGLAGTYNAIRRNGPLLRLLAAFLPVNLLGGMAGGVAYLYLDTYLGLGKQFPAIMALALLASIAGIPFWIALSARYERHRVWAASLAIGAVVCAVFMMLSPGPLALPLAFVLYPLLIFTLIGAVIVYAMSADIVDYGRIVTGEDHAGLYGSLFAFLQKSLMGVSAAAGLALAGVCGFDATAATQTASGVVGIKLAGALLPAVGLFGAALIIWNYPLTRARIAEVQAQLGLRQNAGAGS
jgi:GPH family glycoside/pentoside/hexuronide:cation symporter